jgi:hypothetical protein
MVRKKDEKIVGPLLFYGILSTLLCYCQNHHCHILLHDNSYKHGPTSASSKSVNEVMKQNYVHMLQLLEDKRQLVEKVESLLQQTRSMDGKYQSQIETLKQRHAVDVERVKQFAVVAEKVRRERWVERQTARIKVLNYFGIKDTYTINNI